MFTFENPNHCPKCLSNNVTLGNRTFKKDIYGEETDTVILGMWFCKECGNVLGQKISQYENDIDTNSI